MCLNTGNISFRVVDTFHSLSVFCDYQEGGGIVPSAGDDAGLGTMQWSGYNAPNHSLANGAWDLPNDGAVIMTRRLMTGTQLPPSSGAHTLALGQKFSLRLDIVNFSPGLEQSIPI